jgi:inner membrane protein
MEIKTSGISGTFRILFKTGFIGALILLLLIPTTFIQNLVNERQARRQEAVDEISSRWAASQTITGPVIGIPYMDTSMENGVSRPVKRWAWFLPDKLDMHARIVPETRYRGIFQVVVYSTEIQVHSTFESLRLNDLDLPTGRMLWNEAKVYFNLTDVQGLDDDLVMNVSTPGPTPHSVDVTMASGRISTDQFPNALSGVLPDWANSGRLDFSTRFTTKGSGQLLFVPVGRETKVTASSSWPNPSFTGSVLPDLRTVKDSGFAANWKTVAINRKFPQQWKQGAYDLGISAFGVSLIIPVDAYQQTTRSVKYAILIILLTFTAFLLIEWIYNRPMYSFQYVLVGFALCIFYTLLLSFSEYLGFNPAYGIAATATIGLIAWYVGSLLRSPATSLFVTFLLAVQYGFVFILIQLQDYALLMGSIGLFVSLALVMYFSRKIKWEQLAKNPHPATH